MPATLYGQHRQVIEHALAAPRRTGHGGIISRVMSGYDLSDEDDVIDLASMFLLVEENVYDHTPWITGHDSAEAAATYRDGQDCPDDWKPVALIDVARRRWLAPSVEVVFRTSWLDPTGPEFPLTAHR